MRKGILSLILLLIVPFITLSQLNINGTVKSNSGTALTKVKVLVKELGDKQLTNKNGEFSFNSLNLKKCVLIFSLKGYQTIFKKINSKNASQIEITLSKEIIKKTQLIQEVTVTKQLVRANSKTPTTYSNISEKDIDAKNFGQDLPYVLNTLPSVIVSSDAGAGVGYTNIRIRGTDPSRTNVTINGIPLNDSESHGVYWVNMPDFLSSVKDIQIQRGVGTSANGASAFGASININTNKVNKKPYGIIDNSYGSFHTWKNTLKAGTGLINNKFSIDTRLSRITSEGYIDRAKSNLKSYYISGSWYGEKSELKATIFSGKEITYQAWYGTPESVIHGNIDEINAYATRNGITGGDLNNLLNSDRRYNIYTYDNEVDNYQQDHYQLYFNHDFSDKLNFTTTLHYTRGKGFYEQYKKDEDFDDYGFTPIILANDTISNTDLIRRRWLDNHFYGGVFSLSYKTKAINLILGGGTNRYTGDHFGEVIWAEYASESEIRDKYYDNNANKLEAHAYIKGNYSFKDLTLFADLQYRFIDYTFLGIDEVNGDIIDFQQNKIFNFFNPKAGIMYDFNKNNNTYFSVAIANREPVRRDFRESTPTNQPIAEKLINYELGYRFKSKKLIINTNIYHMQYENQLVLTGQINDVGGYTRTNVPNSYRTGIEFESQYKICNKLTMSGNIALSLNKIKTFIEYTDNYDTGDQEEITHNGTDLSFSPNIIANAGISYTPFDNLNINLMGKHVGDQFLDNTSNTSRKINDYTICNLTINYTLKNILFKEITFGLMVNNLFNKMYENNGYTWGYIYGGIRTTENFYFPQAGRNYLLRLNLKI